MTDTRRTILWIVFSLSLFLIWDAWMRHNGKPSFLSPAASRPAAASAAAAAPPVASAPAMPGVPGQPATATVTTGALPAAAPAPLAAASAAEPAAAERVTVTTDLVRATLDSRGGELMRLELLQHADTFDRKKREILFDATRDRLYLAQTGLVPAAGGSGLPNHHTVMRVVPGPRELGAGADALRVAFESPPIGGVKLTKTYTFRRGSYVVDVRHDVTNESGQPIDPRLYLQLVRDGNAPPTESGFLSNFAAVTYTGPAIYTDGHKFRKVEFSSIEKRSPTEKPEHDTVADNGWIAMIQHYFASAWLVDRKDARPPREYFTAKADVVNPGTGQTAHVYSVGMLLPLGTIAPGQTKSFDAQLFAGPQEENQIAQLAPGLELVKDYGIFKILAEPLFWLLTQLHKLFGNWGWSIVGLVVLLKVGSSRVDLQACKLEYSIVSPK